MNPNKRPSIEERYTMKQDEILHVLNYVIYKSTTGSGNDEVLQHKLFGTTETAHITWHPDGSVNFRVKINGKYLKSFVLNELSGFSPTPSQSLKKFLKKVWPKLP